MTRENIKRYFPYLEAIHQGKTVQYKGEFDATWTDIFGLDTDWFNDLDHKRQFRIKPDAPRVRAWTMDEVPLGCWFKPKGESARYASVLVVSRGVKMGMYAPGSHDNLHSFDSLLSGFKHSIDGGLTWKECGVYE